MGTRLFSDQERGIESSRQTNHVAKSLMFRWNLLGSRCPCYCLRCLAAPGFYRFPSTEDLRLEAMKLVDVLFGLCSMRLATLAGDILDAVSKALSDTCPCAKKKFWELERLEFTRFWRGGNVAVFFLLLHFQTRAIVLRCQLDGGFLQGRSTFLALRF